MLLRIQGRLCPFNILPGNENTDVLAAAAMHATVPTVVLDKYTYARRLILGREQRRHPHAHVARGSLN